MRHYSTGSLLKRVGFSLLGWTMIACACLCVGSTGKIGWPESSVLKIRLEPVLIASLVGAGLASAGVVYQTILRNPLADPYLLGVSSGASLFAYLWRFPQLTAWLAFPLLSKGAISQQGFAMIGALLAVGIVLGAAGRRGRLDPVTLILVGVIVNAVCGAITILVYKLAAGLAGSGGELTFMIGGLQRAVGKEHQISAVAVFIVGWIALLFLSGEMSVAQVGEAEAQSLGVRVNRLRWVGLLIASIMTASVVAISGPIGFVGLICPHLARMLVGTDVRKILPVATGLGAGLLCIADAGTRLLAQERFSGQELPVGVVTALLGGPFFLLILLQRARRMSRGEGLV